MKESMRSAAGARVKKLTTTGTFHSLKVSRGTVSGRKEKEREAEAKNKRSEREEDGVDRDIVLCSLGDTEHHISHTEATHAENNACLYRLSARPSRLIYNSVRF